MTDSDAKRDDRTSWWWVAVAAGAALSTAAAIWLLWYGDPAHRMDRILRRCQDRIGDIEEALSDLEVSLRPRAS